MSINILKSKAIFSKAIKLDLKNRPTSGSTRIIWELNVPPKHKHRPWDHRRSYRIARCGVAGMRRVLSATTTGTFMRVLDNCTYECDATVAIANEMYEMQKGAGMSESQMTTALQKLVGKNLENPYQERKRSGFYTRFHAIVLNCANADSC